MDTPESSRSDTNPSRWSEPCELGRILLVFGRIVARKLL
jgi:hypothetical protein